MLRDKGELMEHILPLDALLSNHSKYSVKDKYSKYLYNGNKLYKNQLSECNSSFDDKELVRIYHNNDFIALYSYDKAEDIFKPYKMFLG